MTRSILIFIHTVILVVALAGLAGAQSVNIAQFKRFAVGDDTVILGVVENNSQRPVTAVRLTAHAYQGDERIASSVAGTFLDVILPGQSSPFMVTIPEVEGRLSRYQLELQAEPAQVAATPELSFSEQSFDQADGVYAVTGAIRNDGTQAAEQVWVIISGYDAEQNLVAVEAVLLDLEVLEADDEAPFSITFESPFRPVTRVFLQLQSQAVVRL